MRILLVEDEASIREIVKLNLEMEDYEVVTTGDGKRAIKHFQEEHFDLILLILIRLFSVFYRFLHFYFHPSLHARCMLMTQYECTRL